LPSPLLGDPAFRAGLLQTVDYATDSIDDCGDARRPLASIVAEQFAIEDIRPGPDATAALARHGTLASRVLVAVAQDPGRWERWARFAVPFVAAAKAVPIAERPRLLLLGGAAISALTARDPLLSDVWWWGVLDRLDTAFHVKNQLGGTSDDLRRDSIAEVAGFDLRLADHLATTWDGSAATLPASLKHFDGPSLPDPGSPTALRTISTPLSTPPASLLPMWEQGLVDRWDSFPAYWHACVLPTPAELRSRIWRAQVRALMPTIDEERARIEGWLRRQVQGLANDAALEPRDLYVLLQEHPYLKTWRGGHRKRLIYWLRDARNTLAHMGLLTPGEVARGWRLIAEDRRG